MRKVKFAYEVCQRVKREDPNVSMDGIVNETKTDIFPRREFVKHKHGLLRFSILLILGAFVFTGCAEVMDQINKMANFTKCQFRLVSVDNVSLAGVVIQGAKASDISVLKMAKLTAAFTSGKLPLNFTLNMEVKNPNDSPAGMNKMAWIAFVDDNELTNGTMEKSVDIPANGVGTLPLSVGLDLKDALTGKTLNSMINLALNIAGEGTNPSRLTMKVKPSVKVAGQELVYPDYVTVSHEFAAK
jgi:LEA14-like dessication related protein